MVNPYLMAPALLKAFDDGLKHKLDPGKPESATSIRRMEAGKQVKKLPMTLGDALEALKNDEVIKIGDAGRDVPGSSTHISAMSGSASWHTVTEWDLQAYLDCLP